jgi:hypothetical protein
MGGWGVGVRRRSADRGAACGHYPLALVSGWFQAGQSRRAAASICRKGTVMRGPSRSDGAGWGDGACVGWAGSA